MPRKEMPGIRQAGLALLIVTVCGSIVLGGNMLLFLHIPALLIVSGITIGTLLMTYGADGLRVLAVLPRFLLGVPVSPDSQTAEVARSGAHYALVAGSLGTLIGVLQMLATLDDPSKVGGGIADALLSVLYGLVLAELLLNPLASRLDAGAPSTGAGSATSARGIVGAVVGLSIFIGIILLWPV